METNDILSKINHQSGMTVPDGYFADFNRRMAAELPPIDFEKGEQTVVVRRNWWQRTRPYIYMAAMFAGVWCMMKMFDMMRPSTGLTLESHPAVTAALSNDEFFNYYVVPTIDDETIYDELYIEGFDTTDFETRP